MFDYTSVKYNDNDYNFTWWPTGYNSEYIQSNTHTNTKLGYMTSYNNNIMTYIYSSDVKDNLFYKIDQRRATVADLENMIDMTEFTYKQRAYVEWYYITRGLPIEANPSVDVAKEFDKYWVLSNNGIEQGSVKYMSYSYINLLSKISPPDCTTDLEMSDYYCSWCTNPLIAPLRSIYCSIWDGDIQTCLTMQYDDKKSIKFTEYVKWCINNHIISIDDFIQPTMEMMIEFERYLRKTNLDMFGILRFALIANNTIDTIHGSMEYHDPDIKCYDDMSNIIPGTAHNMVTNMISDQSSDEPEYTDDAIDDTDDTDDMDDYDGDDGNSIDDTDDTDSDMDEATNNSNTNRLANTLHTVNITSTKVYKTSHASTIIATLLLVLLFILVIPMIMTGNVIIIPRR